MVARKLENKYKSKHRGEEGVSCDIIYVFPEYTLNNTCPCPSETCVGCPVGVWWNGTEKKTVLASRKL